MSTQSRDVSAPCGADGPADPLASELGAVYALTQESPFVFASPLGPFSVKGRQHVLHRFVFFGPRACDDSWRVAFLAGLDPRDPRSSRALLGLVSRLAGNSETGHGLNLTFFPLVDTAGREPGAADRGLSSLGWDGDDVPEIALLGRDARQRGYHGFVRVETGSPHDEMIAVRVRGPFRRALSPDLELITSDETRSFPVRFESIAQEGAPRDGPLSLSDQLPHSPFELVLSIPGSWSDQAYQHAAVTLLERFLRRYRAYQAYGQHL